MEVFCLTTETLIDDNTCSTFVNRISLLLRILFGHKSHSGLHTKTYCLTVRRTVTLTTTTTIYFE
jgi:hypothetical protein